MTIKLVNGNKFDWMGLYINNELVFQADFIDYEDIFEQINKKIENNYMKIKDRFYFENVYCDDEWLDEKGFDFPAFYHQVVLAE